MSSRGHFTKRLKHIFHNLPEKTEPVHVYGMVSAGGLAIIELFSPESFSPYLKAGTLLSLVIIIVVRLVKRADELPDVNETEFYREYRIDIPCTLPDLEKASDIASFYFQDYTIGKSVVKRNRELNKLSFVISKDHRGKVVGFIDLFYLKGQTLKSLIDGSITEPELVASDVVVGTGAGEIYIGGFAISPDVTKVEKQKIAYGLTYAMLVMLRKHITKDGQSLNIFAIGYTKKGRSWLEKMGVFSIIEDTSLPKETPPYKAIVRSSDLDAQLAQFRVARVFTKVRISP